MELVLAAGKTVAMGRLRTVLNRAWAKAMLGADGEYWAKDWQLALQPDRTQWIVEPNAAAPNETLLDGRRISTPAALEDGMQLAVGREATGVVKTPMVVKLR